MLRVFYFKEVMRQYRKDYISLTGRDVPNNWHIHHLDKDRLNNNINNLVAVPQKLHIQIHNALTYLPEKYITIDFQDVVFMQYWEELKGYIDVFHAAGRCVDYRNHLYCQINGDSIAGYGCLRITKQYSYKDIEDMLKEINEDFV